MQRTLTTLKALLLGLHIIRLNFSFGIQIILLGYFFKLLKFKYVYDHY